MSKIDRFFIGFTAFLKGIHLVFGNSKLRKLAILPSLISFMVLILGISFGWSYIPEFMSWLTTKLSSGFWGEFLLWLITIVMAFIYFVFCLVFLIIIANIVNIPFLALIAEATLIHEDSELHRVDGFSQWIRFNGFMIGLGMIKAAIFIVLGVFLFLFSFIPVISAFAAFFGFVLVAYDCCDYSLELKNYSLKQRFKFFKENIFQLSGFATAIGFTFFIPGVNFFILPSLVAGGAWLVNQINKSKY